MTDATTLPLKTRSQSGMRGDVWGLLAVTMGNTLSTAISCYTHKSLADIFLLYAFFTDFLSFLSWSSKVSTSFYSSCKVSSKCKTTSKTTHTTLEAQAAKVCVPVSASDEKWQFQSSSMTTPTEGKREQLMPKMNHQKTNKQMNAWTIINSIYLRLQIKKQI